MDRLLGKCVHVRRARASPPSECQGKRHNERAGNGERDLKSPNPSSIANAYEENGRGDYFAVLARIREVFNAEWDSPTEIPTGKLTPKPDAPPMNEAESYQQPVSIATDPSIPATEKRASLREMATDAMRYWEPRRVLYNAVLALIVIGYFFASWPASQRAFTFDGVLFLFILAVLANGCYCAAYIPDLFAQFTGFRPLWLRWRGLLLALGIVFAAIITRFFCIAFFAITAPNGN